ncbi:hypothetical protein JL722_8598 [Aureococcus anophagefferens]|nr:hypothetical protein JL722_8598 [Aureococcus anophagefferens]
MATFDESVWCDVPLVADDETNVWGQAESTLATAAQLRAGPEMDSAKVAVLGRGTAVRLLQRCVGATGALRVRVRDANAVTGWLTSKMLAPPAPLATAALVARARAEFVPGVTAEGVSFLRTRVGAVGVPDAETPVLVVLHGTSYNAGVWIPTFKRLHEAPGTSGGIVVIEPILFRPLDKPPSGAADASGLIKGTLVKKKHFDVPSEDGVVDYLTKTAMGKQWEGEAVRSFVAHGVAPAAGGGFDLRCDPAVEAAIYVNSGRSAGRAYERLQDIDCPCFTCIGHDSAMNGNGSSQAHRDNGKLATTYLGNCVVLKKCDHYVPMENSAWCASFVAAALAKYRGPDYAGLTYWKK